MYRVIYSLCLEFDNTLRGGSSEILVHLNRKRNNSLAQAANQGGTLANVPPRPSG
jgi:hypothetical protein